MLLVANSFSRRLMQMWAICQAFCWESWSHKQWANSLWILTHTLHRQEKFAFSPKVYFVLPPFPSSPRPPSTPSTPCHRAPSQPTGTRQASTWWLWWYSQGEPPREAFLLKLTEVGMQDLLNYLNRQMLHSVHFLTSSYFSKNWHFPMALHIRTVHGFYSFYDWILLEILGTLPSARLKAAVLPADGCVKQNVPGKQAPQEPSYLKPGLLSYFQVILHTPFQETQMLSIWQVCPNGSFNNMVKHFKYCSVFDDGAQGEATSSEKPS